MLGWKYGEVRLGIDAPIETVVNRQEVHEARRRDPPRDAAETPGGAP